MNDEELIEKKLQQFHHGIDQTINSAANWNYSMNNFVEIIRKIKDDYTERSKQLQNNVEILLEKKRQLEDEQRKFMEFHINQITIIKSSEAEQKAKFKALRQKLIEIRYARLDLDRDEANLKLCIERKSDSDSLLSESIQKAKLKQSHDVSPEITKLTNEIESLDNQLKIMNKKEAKLQKVISALGSAKKKFVDSKFQLFGIRNQIKIIRRNYDDIQNVESVYEILKKRLDQIRKDHKANDGQIQQTKEEIQHYQELQKGFNAAKQQKEKLAAGLFDRVQKQNEELCNIQNEIYKYRKILEENSSNEIKLHSEITAVMLEISNTENECENINQNFEEIDDMLRSKTPEEALEERKIELAQEELNRLSKSLQKQKSEYTVLTEQLENTAEYQKKKLSTIAESHIAEMKAISKDSKSRLEAAFKEIQSLEEKIDKILMIKNVLEAEQLRLSNDLARKKLKYLPIDKITEIRLFKSKQALDRLTHEISLLESKINEISNRIHFLTDSTLIKQVSIQNLLLDFKSKPHTKLEAIAMRIEASKNKAETEINAYGKFDQIIENAKRHTDQKDFLLKWDAILDDLYCYMESAFVQSYVFQYVL